MSDGRFGTHAGALKISLVTCSYQQGRFIEATMRSVIGQNFPDLEYIVVDGGSKDGTLAVLERYEPMCSRIISEPDNGQTDALIKGFRLATGDIMGWLCSDDLLLPGALQKVQQYFETHPDVMAVYGDSLWIDEGGNVIRAKREMPFNRFVFLYDHNYIPQPSMFWRRSLYERVGGLDASYDMAMDNDLWERFSRVTRIAHMPQLLSCMRFYEQQKTRSRPVQGAREDAQIRRRSAVYRYAPWTYPACHALAKTVRIAAKLRRSAYSGSVPESVGTWISRHRIPVSTP